MEGSRGNNLENENVEESAVVGDTLPVSEHSSVTDPMSEEDQFESPMAQDDTESPFTDTLHESVTQDQKEDSSQTGGEPEAALTLKTTPSTLSTKASPMPKSRGPVSPFSPLLRGKLSTRTDSSNLWQNKENDADLSLISCRSVTVAVRVHVPQKLQPKRLCLFPLVSENISTPTNLMSPISATIKAASATETKDLVLVNPSAFGKFIPGEFTVETARLVANVANIETEDWARRFRFDEVVWPNVEAGHGLAPQPAFARLAQSIANDTVMRQQRTLCLGMGGQGSGRTLTMFGTSAYNRRGEVTPERYGLMGLTFAALLEQLPDNAVCTMSILEIVDDDTLRDLLANDPVASQSKLRIRHPDNKGATVQNLSDVPLDSLTGLEHLTRKAFHSNAALRARKREGAPGHVLATIKVWQNGVQYDLANGTKCTTIHFVDLASGEDESERLDARSIRRMACFRNSVSALLGVLRGILLREAGETSSRAICYRECMLTKLLQRPLERQDNRTVILAAVSAGSESYDRTLHTLDYANRLLIRPGKTAQSPFVSSARRHTDATTSSPEAFLEHLGSADNSDNLLKNVLSDPRQRLAKLMKKQPAPSSSLAPRKLDLDNTKVDEAEHDYEPTDYMDIDPANMSSRVSDVDSRRRLEDELAVSKDEMTGLDIDPEGLATRGEEEFKDTMSEPSFIENESEAGWSDDELEVSLEDRKAFRAELAFEEPSSEKAVSNAMDRMDKRDPFYLDGQYEEEFVDSVFEPYSNYQDTMEEVSEHLDAEDQIAAVHVEDKEHIYGDERDPFDLAARLADRWGLGQNHEASTIQSTGMDRLHYPQEHLDTAESTSDFSGLRSDVAEPAQHDDHQQAFSKLAPIESTSTNNSLLPSHVGSLQDTRKSLGVTQHVAEGDGSETYPTHAPSVSTLSRKSLEATPNVTLSNADRAEPSPLDISPSPTGYRVDPTSSLEGYIEEIESLEGNVEQIRRLHSGIYQSSALSLQRLRNHQLSQQRILDEADRARMTAEEQLGALQVAAALQRRKQDAALAYLESKCIDLESKLETALKKEGDMGKIAEEAIAAQDKLEQDLSQAQQEYMRLQEEADARIAKYDDLVSKRNSIAEELEETSRALRSLRSEHSRCEKIIAGLKGDVEALSHERSRLEEICHQEREQLRGYAELKAKHSSFLSRHEAMEEQISQLRTEKAELTNAMTKQRIAAANQQEHQQSQIVSLERQVSSLQIELASIQQRTDEDAATADALIRELKAEKSKLRIELSDLKRKQSESEASLAASRQIEDDTSHELSRIAGLLRSREEDLNRLNSDLASIQTEYDNERKTRLDKEEALRSLKGDARDKVERLLDERKKLQGQLATQEDTIRDMQASAGILQGSLEAAVEERDSAQDSLVKIRRELENERQSKLDIEARESEVRANLEESEAAVTLLRAEIENVKSTEPEDRAVRKQLEEERIRCSNAESSVTTLKSELEEREAILEAVRAKLNALESVHHQVQERMQEKTNAIADEEKELAVLQARLEESEKERANISEELSSLKSFHETELAHLCEQIRQEQQAKRVSDGLISSLQAQLDESESKRESLRQELQMHRSEVQKLLRKELQTRESADSLNESLRLQFAEAERQQMSFQQERSTLETSQKVKMDELKELICQEQLARSDAESNLASLQSQLDESERNQESLRQELDTLAAAEQGKYENLQELIRNERHARSRAEDRIAALQSELSDRQKMIDSLRTKVQSLSSSQASITELNTRVHELQRDRDEADSGVAALESRLKASQRALEGLRSELQAARVPASHESEQERDMGATTEAEALLMREMEADELERRVQGRHLRSSLDFDLTAEEITKLQHENSILRRRLQSTVSDQSYHDSTARHDLSQLTIDRLRTEKMRAQEIAASLAAQTKRVVDARNEEVMRLKMQLSQLAEEKESEITVLRARLLAMKF